MTTPRRSRTICRAAHAIEGGVTLVLRRISWPLIGCALVLVGAFVELGEELHDAIAPSSRLLGFDAAVLRFVLGIRVPWLTGVAMDVTALGSPVVVALVTIATGGLLLVAADRQGAAVLATSSFAAIPLTSAMKALVGRPRPDVIPRLLSVSGLSYPSGHALAAAMTYFTAALLVAHHLPLRRQRVGALVFAAIVVVATGASRVYLGVHYPSDVAGGILLGTAWALGVALVLRRASPAHAGSPPASPPEAER